MIPPIPILIIYGSSGNLVAERCDQYVKAQVKRLCIKWRLTGEWSSRLASEVVEFICVDSLALWERPPVDVVNVKNGLLRVDERSLLPHLPEHLSSVQIPVDYNPAAYCPKIEEFVGQVFPDDTHDLAWEVPAWLMRADLSIQKAVLATGEGANRKSTYLSLVMTFIGKPNTSAVSLHKLESNQFAVARLMPYPCWVTNFTASILNSRLNTLRFDIARPPQEIVVSYTPFRASTIPGEGQRNGRQGYRAFPPKPGASIRVMRSGQTMPWSVMNSSPAVIISSPRRPPRSSPRRFLAAAE